MQRLLLDFLFVFLVSGIVVYALYRLRIPAVVGLLISGVLVGPHGLSLVGNEENVHLLAEVGIVVLLFSVGLEFSVSRLVSMSKLMLEIGVPQCIICAIVTFLATYWYFDNTHQALFAGMLVAMSSTAIVMKLLADRGELSSPHGRIDVAVLLLQDLLVVVCVLAVPLLAQSGGESTTASDEGLMPPAGQNMPWWISLPLGVIVVAAILVAGKYLVPRLLYLIVKTRNRELFLITIFVIGIGTATLTGWVGLSLALGAFLSGLALAESEYGHQTLAEVLPFRDTLSSLFFVSVGMLLDVQFLFSNVTLVLLSVLALILLKFFAVAVPAILLGHPLRTAILSGLALAQIGEFSFVLANAGRAAGLLNGDDYQTFLAAAVLTMSITPLLIQGGPLVVERMERWPWLDRFLERGAHGPQDGELSQKLNDHLIIAGYGFNGRILANVLSKLEIPYVVLEMNPETVRLQRAKGESILFGDCTRPAVLQQAGIERARTYVVGISDPVSTRRTVQIARQLQPHLHIAVRTRYRNELDELQALGADEVIPEEFEASVEIFTRVLRTYQVPGNVINEFVAQLRSDHYEVFREESLGRQQLELPDSIRGLAETETVLIDQESNAVSKTLSDLRLRELSGASVLAIQRQREIVANPGANEPLNAGDVVVLLGTREQINAATQMLAANS